MAALSAFSAKHLSANPRSCRSLCARPATSRHNQHSVKPYSSRGASNHTLWASKRSSFPARLQNPTWGESGPTALSALTSADGSLDDEDEEEQYEEAIDDEMEEGGPVATLTEDSEPEEPVHVNVEAVREDKDAVVKAAEASADGGVVVGAALSAAYTATMQGAMANNALVYEHELGMNYARVLPDLIVGSCPQTAADIDILRDRETVGSVMCLQQDSDLAWFGMDLHEIVGRTVDRGDIKHVRQEIRDFDPVSLRLELPMAVAKMHKANRERGTVYVHCTAGLGRAPAVALAYMWWLRDFPRLEDANEVLQAVRRCGPKLFAIRAALCDLLTGNPREQVTVRWRNRGVMPKKLEVAGIDVGWHNKLPLEREGNTPWWTVTRELAVGTYYYKFIVDGDKWTYNPDAPLTAPDRDNNINNYYEVVGASLDPAARALRKRLMEDEVVLEAEERALVLEKLNQLADSLP